MAATNQKSQDTIIFSRSLESANIPKPIQRLRTFEVSLINGMIETIRVSHPEIALEIDSIVNNRIPVVKDQVHNILVGIGGGGLRGIASVFSVITAGLSEDQVSPMLQAISVLGAQHISEVIPDGLDKGNFNDSDREALLDYLSSIARDVLEGSSIPDMSEELSKFRTLVEINDLPGNYLHAKVPPYVRTVASFLFGIRTNHLVTLTYEQLLRVHIDSLRGVKQYLSATKTIVPDIDRYLISSLDERYNGLKLLLNGSDANRVSGSYSLFEIPESHVFENELGSYVFRPKKDIEIPLFFSPDVTMSAITLREMTVMVGSTMSIVVRELASQNELVAFAVNSQSEEIVRAMRLASKLIGMYNDIGSPLLRMSATESTTTIKALRSLGEGSFREILVPEWLSEAITSRKLSTSEFVVVRAEDRLQDIDFFLQFGQLIKDSARHEANILLDVGGTQLEIAADWQLRIKLLQDFNRLATYMTSELESILKELHPQIADVIRRTVVFHEDMYAKTEYYGDNSTNLLSLETMQGRIRKVNETFTG